MITLSDQHFISLPLPNDTKESNVVLNGATITIESPAQYLSRVDINSRYLKQEVDVQFPYGTYGINDYISKINSQLIVSTKYAFLDGTEDQYFVPMPCCASSGEGFDPSMDYIISGDWVFTGYNIHNGTEVFKNVIFASDGSITNWTTTVNTEGDLVFTNNSTSTIIKFTPDGIYTDACIQAPGIFVEGQTGFLKADCTIDDSTYISEEVDPVFTSWDKSTGITITVSQILDPENIPCTCNSGGDILPCLLELTEQDCLNIKSIDDKFAEFNCSGMLHNSLDGLQGGIVPDEYYHLSLAELTFLQDIILNGSGVLTLHSELSDVQSNYTHQAIDDHINDASIHFTLDDVITEELDPVFNAERNSLLENYLVMKGTTTLVDSPIHVTNEAIYIENYPIWTSHGVGNVSLGFRTAQYYDPLAMNNVAIGNFAGTFLYDEVSLNEFPSYGIYLGTHVRPSLNNNYNETIIGNNISGNGSNTVTIGNSSVTDNYFNGNILASESFIGQELQLDRPTIYVRYDIDGNMIFNDEVVGEEVTLTDLLAGGFGGGSWDLTANNTNPISVSGDQVNFMNTSNITASRTSYNMSFDLTNTGTNTGTFTNPTLTVDAKGRITAIADGTSGCEQSVADMGTQNGNMQFDLDNYSGAIVTLNGDLNIQFVNVMEGDTGHIEVTHTGLQTLSFSAPAGWTIKIANANRQAANEVLLSSISATDVVAYWFAKTKVHMAVIYDTK